MKHVSLRHVDVFAVSRQTGETSFVGLLTFVSRFFGSCKILAIAVVFCFLNSKSTLSGGERFS